MTARARHWAGARFSAVSFPEVSRVTRWFGASHPRAYRAARAGGGQRCNRARRRADMAAHAALTRVTGGARCTRSLCLPSMRAQPAGGRVAGRNELRRRVSRRPIVECQRENHWRLGRVHVTREAQIPRVARGAARRDCVRSRGHTCYSRNPAVAAEQEIRRGVRLGFRETRNDFAGQARCISQPHMAGRASRTRDIKVGRLESVAVQTLSNYCVLHTHPWCAGHVMARGTVRRERAVSGVRCCRDAAVCLVGEPQIAGWRSGSRFPRDSWFYYAVVARRAARRLGPHGLPRFNHSHVTRGAQWEHLGVLVVWEGISRCPCYLRRGEQCTCC